MDNQAIFVIKNYILLNLFEPARNWSEYEFRRRSYERWSAVEILKSIQKQPDRPSIEVVEDFIRKTDEYSGIDHDDRNDSFIFQVAHDVATDILSILRDINKHT